MILEVFMKFIKIFFNYLHIVFVIIAEVLLLGLIVIVSINVILRNLWSIEFLRPIMKIAGMSWANEIPSFVLMPIFILIGLTVGIKEDFHININILPPNLPKWFEFFLIKLKYSITLIIGIVFLKDGMFLVKITNRSILPASELPASLQYIILPIVSIPIIYISIMNLLGISKEDSHLDKILHMVEGEEKTVEGDESV
jgi:TRAP-type transport system small permease protein